MERVADVPGANRSLDPRFLDGRARLFLLLPSSPFIDAANNNFAPKDLADLAHLDGDKSYSEPAPLDHGGQRRYIDHPVPDTGVGSGALMDMGAHEVPCSRGRVGTDQAWSTSGGR